MKRCQALLIVIGLLLAPAASLMAATPGTESSSTNVVTLTFDLLKSWTYVESQRTPVPDVIKRLDGRAIEITGFMLPLTEIKDITQFVFAPSIWGCCYGQPPAPNHLIIVNMAKGQTAKVYTDMIRVRGTFHVGEIRQDGYLLSLYTITAQEIKAQ